MICIIGRADVYSLVERANKGAINGIERNNDDCCSCTVGSSGTCVGAGDCRPGYVCRDGNCVAAEDRDPPASERAATKRVPPLVVCFVFSITASMKSTV